jgi:hypothetical protein
MAAAEDEPTAKCGGPAFASATGLYSEGISHTFEDIAQANVFGSDEPGKTNPERLATFTNFLLRISCAFLFHGTRLAARAVSMTW